MFNTDVGGGMSITQADALSRRQEIWSGADAAKPVGYVFKRTVNQSLSNVLHALDMARMRARLQTMRNTLAEERSRTEKLSLQLIASQEQERMNLALELHDEMGQRLTVLKVDLHHLLGFLKKEEALDVWKKADADVVALIAQIRTISMSLRPPALDYLGLEAAVRQMLTAQFGNTGTTTIFEYAGLPAKFAPFIEITVYRIIQESITNIVRHAHATRVVVEINGGETGEELELIVRDNGCGFDLDSTLAAHTGCGLRGMHERITLLGGRFAVDTVKGQGTRIVASFCLKNKLAAV
jgi:signal transduction histidine kinase